MVIYAWFVYKQTDTQPLLNNITRNLVSEVNYVGMVALIIQLFVTILQVAWPSTSFRIKWYLLDQKCSLMEEQISFWWPNFLKPLPTRIQLWSWPVSRIPCVAINWCLRLRNHAWTVPLKLLIFEFWINKMPKSKIFEYSRLTASWILWLNCAFGDCNAKK